MIDKEKIEQATRLFLEGIGEDPERSGIKDTPDRIARMCEEVFGGTAPLRTISRSNTRRAAVCIYRRPSLSVFRNTAAAKSIKA